MPKFQGIELPSNWRSYHHPLCEKIDTESCHDLCPAKTFIRQRIWIPDLPDKAEEMARYYVTHAYDEFNNRYGHNWYPPFWLRNKMNIEIKQKNEWGVYMTESEYDKKMFNIEMNYKNAKKELMKEYGLSNAKYKVGDIIRDRTCRIKIEKICVEEAFKSRYPKTVYYGSRVKKDGTPTKKERKEYIYQQNIKIN